MAVTLRQILFFVFFLSSGLASPLAKQNGVKSGCSPNPCKNGGLCQTMFNQVFCTCTYPYFGQFCESRADVPTLPSTPAFSTPQYTTSSGSGGKCHPGACGNGGLCVDQPNGFYCRCFFPFKGPLCCDFDMPTTFTQPVFSTRTWNPTFSTRTWPTPTFATRTWPTPTFSFGTTRLPTWPTRTFETSNWPTWTQPTFGTTKLPTWSTRTFSFGTTKVPTWPSFSTQTLQTRTFPPFSTQSPPTFPSFGTTKFPTFPTFTFKTTGLPDWSTTFPYTWPSWATTPMDPCQSRTDYPWNLAYQKNGLMSGLNRRIRRSNRSSRLVRK